MDDQTEKTPSSKALSFAEPELGKDDILLASLGYKAELKREFTAFEVFAFAFSIVGLLPSIASTLVFSMPNGGPVGMVFKILYVTAKSIVGLGLARCLLFYSFGWLGDGRTREQHANKVRGLPVFH
jgi:hypothetical protein